MSTYEISKSSLLSLKAEILRKQEELNKAKAENDVKIRNLKKNSPLDLKNKGVEQRQILDSEEDDNLLKKSREILEAKSKLYEKLTKRSSELTEEEAEYYRRFLVRFDRKSRVPDLPPDDSEDDVDGEEETIHDNYEPPRNRDEEWVEYVDCLGRTRTCLRKDLEYLKMKDKDLKLIVESKQRNRKKSRSPEPPPKPKTPEPKLSEENELLSSDMRREILRRHWEEEEESLRNKSDIHYQDILFDEARTHGVGYYGFSKDEEERSKQQAALKKLREETKEQQRKSQELKAMREKQLAARVRAAQNRKRERMGLPPVEDEPQPTPQPEKTEEKEETNNEKQIEVEEKRKKHVRPWDIGKEGVKQHYEYTQEEWTDKKRKERHAEFAPPSLYEHTRTRTRDRRRKYPNEYREHTPPRNESSDDEATPLHDYKKIKVVNRSRGAEIPPPSYDYGPTSSRRQQKQSEPNVSESIEAGLKFLREQMEKKQTSNKAKDVIFS